LRLPVVDLVGVGVGVGVNQDVLAVVVVVVSEIIKQRKTCVFKI